MSILSDIVYVTSMAMGPSSSASDWERDAVVGTAAGMSFGANIGIGLVYPAAWFTLHKEERPCVGGVLLSCR